MTPEAITAPYEGFRQGLCHIRGYCLEDRDNRISLAFEPWFTESDRPNTVPCVRIDFRRIGDRVVLERFAVCDGTEERVMDLDAAHDGLQSWLDCTCL
ncbi:MAG TPA: hypothetical protein VEY12_06990 [Thermoplasmata archaeon]|nr:hypothetical protein [Thermoplasmata archaeon]